MATRISKHTYGKCSSENYGAHALRIEIGPLDLYFSYDTIVAFAGGDGLKVSENCWGPTTGKHLNAIDNRNKKSRLPRAQFEAELEKVLAKHKLTLN